MFQVIFSEIFSCYFSVLNLAFCSVFPQRFIHHLPSFFRFQNFPVTACSHRDPSTIYQSLNGRSVGFCRSENFPVSSPSKFDGLFYAIVTTSSHRDLSTIYHPLNGCSIRFCHSKNVSDSSPSKFDGLFYAIVRR